MWTGPLSTRLPTHEAEYAYPFLVLRLTRFARASRKKNRGGGGEEGVGAEKSNSCTYGIIGVPICNPLLGADPFGHEPKGGDPCQPYKKQQPTPS
jgi:hypothetical protein